MLSFKIVHVFLVYFYVGAVNSGVIHTTENGIIQKEHNIETRSAFLKPLKHVIGHIAGHLNIHRDHHECEDRHFPHHHDHHLRFPLIHSHNTYPGHNFHDSNVNYGPLPKFPEEKDHGFGFQPHGPPHNPQFDHPKFPVHDNNGNGFHKDRPDWTHKIPINNEESHTIKNEGSKTPVVYPPFHDENDKDDPVSDFDKNKKDKPIVEGGGIVDLESDFSGNENDGKDDDSRDSVLYPEEENTGSGEIPKTSQIDIRFRKN